ncbi:MAG TPA: pyruvate:ferredoxin (flavodoxin) oxidoreductase, partial [Thermoanaerobaculia bacterium]|nr:pyruvate:ferredoxin (flavodoxin) oxidoreductase [Thermoanaerobaculia bacterium]
TDDQLRALLDEEAIAAHRRRALTPDRPVLRGTAQNPDVFFQAREACNPYYDACPKTVRAAMGRFAELTGRSYGLFDYFGHPQAERVLVLMGSGGEVAHETVDWMVAGGEKVGLIKVRLYRPFDLEAFASVLPATVKFLTVLDRTKEPGAIGEPLYQDVVTALVEAREAGLTGVEPRVTGGRYGLSSKEFNPAMVKAVFDEMARPAPKNHFTVGIHDDVTRRSLPVPEGFDIEPDAMVRAVFFGLGADGTVGANKNTIKIIGETTEDHAQGYFVYDSKKSGAITISYLRFGPGPIRSSYLVGKASFVACHQFEFVNRYDVLEHAGEGADFLLNASYAPEEVWDRLPREMQEQILEKKVRLHVIDAYKLAREIGLKGRINTIMQTCFFKITGVLPFETAVAKIKEAIEDTYGKKGGDVLKRNFEAVDRAIGALSTVPPPSAVTTDRRRPAAVSPQAPDFVQGVTAVMVANKGDLLPVSAFPVDGTWPVATSQWEKRNIAAEIPVWDPAICIQCNKCALVCPHAAIRVKTYEPAHLASAPATFKSCDFRAADYAGHKYTVQVAPEDCTGCTLCVMFCPAKDKSNPKHKAIDMHPQPELREPEAENYRFFLDLPEPDRTRPRVLDVKTTQFFQPLFEYSGACAGCGETPYIKLLTQLFGDRILIANATGCSSIYGGNLPTTPYCSNREGRGPAWSNSLFEDNAEFGMGMRLALDSHRDSARELVTRKASALPGRLVEEILSAEQTGEAAIAAQRARVEELKGLLKGKADADSVRLALLSDYLVRKGVWIVGGDGWAYDIGFGGLDHVLASGRDVNVLVLDTEVYSNTGGQQSKATPIGASAKFAAAGKETPKKDLGLIAMSYGNVYVARIAFGAKDAQTVKAFLEAEAYPGPSLLIAYSHCIAHGYDMAYGCEQQKLAVDSGVWPLYRFDPRRIETGQPPLQLDCGEPRIRVEQYTKNENRFRMLERLGPDRAKKLGAFAQKETSRRFRHYQQLATLTDAPKAADLAAAAAPPGSAPQKG